MKRIILSILALLMIITLVGCNKSEPVEEINEEPVEEVEDEIVDSEPVEGSIIESISSLMRWGLDPGLGIDVLHKMGYTGKGVNVAYCDQPLYEPIHNEIVDSVVKYTHNSEGNDGAMHGVATSSILAGKNLGTAPDVNLYFYSYVSWVDDQMKNWVTCLDELIEDNKKLPDGEKIRMVGFSNNPRVNEPYYEDVMKAVKRCNDEDIMVLWCGENNAGHFTYFSDRNNPENLIPETNGSSNAITTIPAGSRTTLSTGNTYEYWDDDGGLSWTMPYTLGVYAIAQSIDSDITEAEIKKLVAETNYVNKYGAKVFQPIEFIARVLEKNDRQKDADELRQAYLDSFKYTYVLYDSSKLSEADMNAISAYSETIIDSYAIMLDCKGNNNAKDIYNLLKNDHEERKGEIVGVQIMGNSDLLSPFTIDYKVDMDGEIDDAGSFYSDYFYQNLNNDTSIICNHYSVYKHFEEKLNVDLVPEWPVARLPLSKNEFTAYFEKYYDFINKNGSKKLQLVNFSNPIFASEVHKDDFGIFLDRMYEEFNLIDNKYTLYGNTLGQYPVNNKTSGSFNQDNLRNENETRSAEIVINSHGQKNNVDLCYFENDKEIRQSVLNSDNINSILSNNYYYLDLWTCNGGADMKDNLTSTALNGKAIGVFSASHIISNNGADNSVSPENMAKSNFYYFFYNYLRSLNSGMSRSVSFFKAQYKYCLALLERSNYGIQGSGNYQFNLCNLLDYENYGVLNNSDHKYMFLDDGIVIEFDEEEYNKLHAFEFYGADTKKNDNGDYEITISFKAPASYRVCIFDPPNGDTCKMFLDATTNGDNLYNVVIPGDIYEAAEGLTISIAKSDDDRWFAIIK